ncbi:MAG: hypothetical protein ACRDRK_26730 [Pseudonocardia sp.]
MRRDVNLDPDRVHAVAGMVDTLLAALLPPVLDPDDLGVCVRVAGGSAVVAQHDLLVAAVARIGQELVELLLVLRRTASAAEAADSDTQRAVRRAVEGGG